MEAMHGVRRPAMACRRQIRPWHKCMPRPLSARLRCPPRLLALPAGERMRRRCSTSAPSQIQPCSFFSDLSYSRRPRQWSELRIRWTRDPAALLIFSLQWRRISSSPGDTRGSRVQCPSTPGHEEDMPGSTSSIDGTDEWLLSDSGSEDDENQAEARECKCTLEDIADKDSVFVQGSSRGSRPTVSHLFSSVIIRVRIRCSKEQATRSDWMRISCIQ